MKKANMGHASAPRFYRGMTAALALLLLCGSVVSCNGGSAGNGDETSAVTVLGRNKVNIYFKDHVYQLKGSKRFNALKYVNIFNRYKNICEGNEHGKFLGL